MSALSALLAPGGTIAAACQYCYELRLHRARGYGALKAILDVLAEEEALTLTEIALRLHRTPGSTKDYLSWLEDVDLIVSRQKRYSFADPMLRLWVRLHCHATPPGEEDIAREVHAYVLARLPHSEPALALAGPVGRRGRGIVEIDERRGRDYRDRSVVSHGARRIAVRRRAPAFAAACAASFLVLPFGVGQRLTIDEYFDVEHPRDAPGRLPPPAGTTAARGRATAAIPAALTCSPR